ncbi:site-2 protease family protein [Candidatus Peregrinibacteria bacterium]|nr:site-2 protease family protein [Candidatus Peregrinibacteria bacterium]
MKFFLWQDVYMDFEAILQNDVVQFLYFLGALLVTLTVHEASHALVAYYLGDHTAKLEGRLSLNPVRHLDFVGSILFLVTQRIGWGKPVPVNPANFKRPVRDSALTALAGPMSNFIFAFLLALPLKYLNDFMPETVKLFLWTIFHVNIFLGVFNLFPFPPLDGSKIVGLFVPRRWYRVYAKYLDQGFKYFVALILIDVFILPDLIGFSLFGYVIRYLHDLVSLILFLGV